MVNLLFLVATWNLPFWAWLLILFGVLVAGAAIGFFVARFVFKRYLKKNPPINENMIRAMYRQMGRTPSEKQVREVMKAVAKNQ